jgi:hypothetical protein
VDYQHGDRWSFELREYVLTRDGHACAYCGARGTPLELDHITPKSRGGSNRASNLTPSCRACNAAKGDRTAAEWGHPDVQARTRVPLRAAAVVTSTRWAIHRALVATGLPLEIGTGGCTKWNRHRVGLPKAHWLDAACVGASTPDALHVAGIRPLMIRAMGHGSRQMCRIDRFGFPRARPKGRQVVGGLRTGDWVRAVVPRGKWAGLRVGRLAVRSSGLCIIQTTSGTVRSVLFRYCRRIQRADGYAYAAGPPWDGELHQVTRARTRPAQRN